MSVLVNNFVPSVERSSGIYNALSALVAAIGTRDLNTAALMRLQEVRPVVDPLPRLAKAQVATMCPRCNESIVEMDWDRSVPPYCELCMDALTRRYPNGVL